MADRIAGVWARLTPSRAAHLRQFLRFAVVGVIQNALNVAVFAAAVAIQVPFLLASIIAAVVALGVSFSLNRRWTFAAATKQTGAQAIRYVSIWVTILLAGLPMLALLVEVGGIPKVLAQATVVMLGAPVSYAAQRRWTFSIGLDGRGAGSP
ncbi:MAG: GtrA family protein [Solirubrobacterales bacterium]|nr:GtrA family protein [Solirubrobacterales bacterium]